MLILGLQKTSLLDYPHLVASTVFTGGCNFKCPYCHNKDLVLNPNLVPSFSVDDILNHLEKKKKILDGVCITGGEPTLQPDLKDFITKIKSLDLKVKLDTNGTNPTILSELIEDKLIDYVAMDIKAPLEKYNIVANSCTLDLGKIEESVAILKNCSIDYEFRTTIAKELLSFDDMKSIGIFLSGAKEYYLQPYLESENVINPIYSSYSKEELLQIIDIIKPYVPQVALRGID